MAEPSGGRTRTDTPKYSFEVSCRHSVTQAIRAFLEADDFEHSARLAISLGGDSDTLACMAGGIAQAFFGGVPEPIRHRVFEILDEPLCDVTRKFMQKFDRPRRCVTHGGTHHPHRRHPRLLHGRGRPTLGNEIDQGNRLGHRCRTTGGSIGAARRSTPVVQIVGQVSFSWSVP